MVKAPICWDSLDHNHGNNILIEMRLTINTFISPKMLKLFGLLGRVEHSTMALTATIF